MYSPGAFDTHAIMCSYFGMIIQSMSHHVLAVCLSGSGSAWPEILFYFKTRYNLIVGSLIVDECQIGISYHRYMLSNFYVIVYHIGNTVKARSNKT